jgi:hypothetical protein
MNWTSTVQLNLSQNMLACVGFQGHDLHRALVFLLWFVISLAVQYSGLDRVPTSAQDTHFWASADLLRPLQTVQCQDAARGGHS